MEQIDVKILDRDYRLAVNSEDQPQLLEAVKLVDGRMRVIRDGGRVAGNDRIAVMAALQLAHELLSAKGMQDPEPSGLMNAQAVKRIQKMTAELDAEIKRQESLF